MIVPVILIILAVIFFLWALTAVAGLIFLIVPWAILGLVAGWIASKIVGSPYGLLGDMLVGIAGSVIGGAIFSIFFHMHVSGILSLPHLLVSIVGAVLLLAVMRAVRRPALS
jgi:uncharacterized membrane protein YeaQ/YmgE (transglycosylase-associated protein family)